jgi:hypothetical protein
MYGQLFSVAREEYKDDTTSRSVHLNLRLRETKE